MSSTVLFPGFSALWTPRGCSWRGLLQPHFEAQSVKSISGTPTLNHRTYIELHGLLGKAGQTVSQPHQS